MAQGKYWCFTDHECNENYDILEAEFVCWGEEIGHETQKRHHQGYAEFKSNKRLGALKKLMPKVHWELRRGTQEDAINYCKKDGVYHEIGERKISHQGKRSDIEEVKELVREGASMLDIVNACSSFQALRFAETALKYVEKPRNWLTEVYWYWGPTGTGKTRTAVEQAGERYWISGKNLKWFEGYDAHEHVIIDDFRRDFCTFHELLRILDRYEYRVEIKGSSRQFLAKKIWITSCFAPEKVYETREDIQQLLRRINFIKKFGIGDGIEVGGNTDPDLSDDDYT